MNKAKCKFMLVLTMAIFLISGCSIKDINKAMGDSFTVTFDGNGGTLVSGELVQTVNNVLQLKYPVFEYEGYIAKGWDVDINMIKSDTTVKVLWVEKEGYSNVIFEPRNGDEDIRISTKNLEAIKKIPNVEREGYTFVGWFNGNKQWDIETEIITEDVTLSAQWTINKYKLTIKKYDGENDLVQELEYGQVIQINEPQSKDGYTFKGWTQVIPEKMPAYDLDLTPLWEIKSYILKINNYYENGTAFEKAFPYHSNVEVDEPKRVGHICPEFKYLVPQIMPGNDMEIDLVWEKEKFNIVIFEYYGNSSFKKAYEYGDVIDIQEPQRYGYTFEEYSEELPLTMPSKDITVKANWKLQVTDVTFDGDNGQLVSGGLNQKVSIFNPILYPTFVRDGYIFVGWDKEFVPGGPITITALWEKKRTTTDETCFRYTKVEDGWKISLDSTLFDGGTLIIPSTYQDEPVVEMSMYIFYSNKLTGIEISSSIKRINISERRCYALSEIKIDEDNPYYYSSGNCIIERSTKTLIFGCANSQIPEEVEIIGTSSFNYCLGLTSINLPSGLKEIKEYAFRDCKSLTEINLPESLEKIGSYAFYGTKISSIFIPKNVEQIGTLDLVVNDFGCTIGIFDYVTVDKENKYYDSRNDSNCIIETATNKLISAAHFSNIPDTIEIIAKGSFTDLSIDEIIFHDGVKILEYYFAKNCNNLKYLYIPSTVELIDGFSAYGCPIETIEISLENKKYDSRNNCNCIIETATNTVLYVAKGATLPKSLISGTIDSYYTYEPVIVIPDGVEKINQKAFSEDYVTYELILPSSIKYLESGWLSGASFKKITYNGTKNEFDSIERIFDPSDENTIWYSGNQDFFILVCTDGMYYITDTLGTHIDVDGNTEIKRSYKEMAISDEEIHHYVLHWHTVCEKDMTTLIKNFIIYFYKSKLPNECAILDVDEFLNNGTLEDLFIELKKNKEIPDSAVIIKSPSYAGYGLK